ncbi:hypothetical protein AFLA_010302 [Aspergillus flavus NRRL3357]|nr:hypothetical protein AFLA_010302 [Aspergillus flavus NRRL3357]
MFRAEASYLLIDCLGGLGRCLTTWMLQELHELTRSQHLDLTVQVVRGDISIGDDISRAISCATKLIKGVVQAAMVLKDTLFTEMSLARFKQVLHPKMLGTILA